MIIGAPTMPQARAGLERTAPTASQNATTADPVAADDPASSALDQLGNFVEAAALSRKAFAEERLKHLKEQMNTLMLFNLAPGFLVNHSARMANELEAAAKDFASSFKTLSGLARAQAEEQGLPSPYLEAIGETASGGLRPTAEDADTAAGFVSVARQLRGVIDLTSDDWKDPPHTRRTADDARNATARVAALMGGLDTPSVFDRMFL